MNFSITSMLLAYSKSNQRKWASDRRLTVGASEVGACIRKTALEKHAQRHGREPDGDYVDSRGAADRGSAYESEIWNNAVRRHRPEGSRLLFCGEDQETLYVGKYLSATLDSLFVNLPRDCLAHVGIDDLGPQDGKDSPLGCIVVDAKSVDPRVNLKGAPKDQHTFQIHAQIGAVRDQTIYRPLVGIITYTNASFFDDIQEFYVRFDPKVFAAAGQRAERAMTANDLSALPPEGKIAGGKECENCSWQRACAEISGQAMPDKEAKGVKLPADQEQALELLAMDVARHGAVEEAAYEQKRAAQFQVKEMLKLAGTRKYSFPSGLKISWSSSIGRMAIDDAAYDAAAKAAGVNKEDFSKAGIPSDRLVVTPPKTGTMPTADKEKILAAIEAKRKELVNT